MPASIHLLRITVSIFLISTAVSETTHDEHLRRAARGDINSIRYMSFSNTIQNKPAEAFNWLKKAAILGDARSQYGVAECYKTGDGVDSNLAEAFNWYKKSADQNFPAALTSLADCYRTGDGAKEDFETSEKLYRKAISLGDPGGKSGLGALLIIKELDKRDKGEQHDFSAALKLIREASDAGENKGHRFLGNAFYLGLGVAQDYSEAISFYEKAAEGGDNKCFMELSICSEKLSDFTKAYMWANIAAACGEIPAASTAKSRLETVLLSRDLVEAQADSRTWLAKFR
jgi:TPR repeat protein